MYCRHILSSYLWLQSPLEHETSFLVNTGPYPGYGEGRWISAEYGHTLAKRRRRELPRGVPGHAPQKDFENWELK